METLNTSWPSYSNESLHSNLTSMYPYNLVLSPAAKTFTITLYTLIFAIGVTGNVSVICIFGIKQKIAKVFHVYIVSLAVADLLLAMASPLVTIHDIVTNLNNWKLFGGFGCKLFVSADHVTMLVSASMLIIISLERIRFMRSDKRVVVPLKGAYSKILVDWVSCICVVAPYTYSLTIKNNACISQWSQLTYYIYYMVYISLSCFLPAIILIVIQARLASLLSARVSRKVTVSTIQRSQCEFQRLSRTAVLISVMYFLLTMPNAIIHFFASYYGTFKRPLYLNYRETFQTLIYIFHTLSHCNCFINPFIYAGMQRVKRIFRKSSSIVCTQHMKLEMESKELL